LDPKRTNGISIMRTQFKPKTDAEIKQLILTANETELSMENLLALQKFIPEPDEIQTLQGYTEDKSKLGVPEQFFLEILTVPQYGNKLAALILKRDFDAKASQLRQELSVMHETCKKLLESAEVKKIFEIILAIGNFLNAGTRRVATAFKLDTLKKLSDIRSNISPKFTLLHYVAQFMEEHHPELVNWDEQLVILVEALKFNPDNNKKEVLELEKRLQSLKNDTKNKEDNPETQQFHSVMEEFAARAEVELQNLNKNLDDLSKVVAEMLVGFGHDASKTEDVNEIWNNFNTFRLDFKNAIQDNRKAKNREEKEAQAKAEPPKGVPKGKAPPGLKDAQAGVLDQLVGAIRQGDFKPKRSLSSPVVSKRGVKLPTEGGPIKLPFGTATLKKTGVKLPGVPKT